MRYGSVCSGIEAATVAWQHLEWKAAWFAEIEAFPSAVLAHHYPDVLNLGDMTLIRERIAKGEIEAPDVLVGGTPCQAFSVAGARNSLDDDRGQLTLEYVRLADEIDAARYVRGEQPAIIVWENVPGVLSTKDNAFGCFLGALSGEDCELQSAGKRWTNAGCVFGPKRTVTWRILDAQYFGVAQRRRRVFVLASARKGFNPTEILFEFDGLRRDVAPSRSAGQEATDSTRTGFAESSFAQFRPVVGDGATIKASGGCLGGGSENLVTSSTVSGKDIFPTLQASMGSKLWLGNQEAFSGDYFVCHGTQDPLVQKDKAFPLGRNYGKENTVFAIQGNMIGRSISAGPAGSGVGEDVCFTLTKGDRHGVYCGTQNDARRDVGLEISPTLRAGNGGGAVNPVANIGLVRRLTPKECERLQGFPDDYTKIPYRNKTAENCPDGPRYAACGNSMAVPVMRWIGERIQQFCGVEV